MAVNININNLAWAYPNRRQIKRREANTPEKTQSYDVQQPSVNKIAGEAYGISNSSQTRAASASKVQRTYTKEFEKAADFYNNKMSSYERYSVTSDTYTNLETRLYKMEQEINQAYIDCEAYSDIMIVPRWHYRFYPYWEDRLINFNITELRERTTKDMNSLQQLKDKVEYIMEKANGSTTHTTPDKTEYDVDKLAKKHLGMSYKDFEAKYKNELEFCKTVTYADLNSMTETQRFVYAKAKAYAKEMLQTTVNEAHTVNWNVGERKVGETLKATNDMYTISDFEDDGITKEGLSKIESGIMFKAFEEALITKHRKLDPTDIKDTKSDTVQPNAIKRVINGVVLIFNPDGTIYDLKGNRIK